MSSYPEYAPLNCHSSSECNTRPQRVFVKFGSDNDLPSGKNPWPELMLTQVNVAIWRQQAKNDSKLQFNDGTVPHTFSYCIGLPGTHIS